MNLSTLTGKIPVTLFPALLFLFVFSASSFAQDRDRIVEKTNKTTPSTEQTQPVAKRPVGLTNDIKVVRQEEPKSLIKKTGSSSMTTVANKASASYYNATFKAMMLNSIRDKMGIRYVYGTQGPNTYDCSGFVWKVFEEAGLSFTRTSAASYWQTFEPVSGDERFQFGTLVFFNGLGHVGIVANKEGFYHASTSKGITFSKFDGYWEKRIVGFRRVPFSQLIFEDPEN
jgi:cell wall-associated NlpC family hydrolase